MGPGEGRADQPRRSGADPVTTLAARRSTFRMSRVSTRALNHRAVWCVGLATLSSCQSSSLQLPDRRSVQYPIWTATISGGNAEFQAPMVVGDRVLADIAGFVVALDTGTGRVLWQTRTTGSSNGARLMRSGPFVLTANLTVEAFSISSGARAWTFSLDSGASLSWNTADSDLVVVGTAAHAVYAIDAATGAQRWRTDAMPGCVYRCITRGIAFSGDTVYAAFDVFLTSGGGGSLGRVVAFARSDGHVLWSWDTARPAPQSDNIGAAPVVYRNVLLLPDTRGGSFFALDRFLLREVWRSGNAGLPGAAGPDTPFLISGDTAFLAGVDGSVYSLEPISGRLLWRQAAGSSINHELAICGGRIMSQNGGLRSHDARTGAILRLSLARSGILHSGVGASATRAFVIGDNSVNAFDC